MSVPLLMGESLVGVLSLYAPSANAFADDCGRLIQMVAPHIAVGDPHRVRRDRDKSAGGESAAAALRLVATREYHIICTRDDRDARLSPFHRLRISSVVSSRM